MDRSIPRAPVIVAWLVIAKGGFRAVFIDQTTALNYAARTHGVCYGLVMANGPDG